MPCNRRPARRRGSRPRHNTRPGIIYRALNGHYVGRTNPATLRLLPDGSCFSNGTSGKLAQGDVGRRYAAAQLERWGADPLSDDEDALAWLRRWRGRLTRPTRRAGKAASAAPSSGCLMRAGGTRRASTGTRGRRCSRRRPPPSVRRSRASSSARWARGRGAPLRGDGSASALASSATRVAVRQSKMRTSGGRASPACLWWSSATAAVVRRRRAPGRARTWRLLAAELELGAVSTTSPPIAPAVVLRQRAPGRPREPPRSCFGGVLLVELKLSGCRADSAAPRARARRGPRIRRVLHHLAAVAPAVVLRRRASWSSSAVVLRQRAS